MTTVRLTNAHCENASPGDMNDAVVRGLQLRVAPPSSRYPEGVRAWRLLYRLPGDPKKRSISLGRFPAVPLSDARRAAQEHLRAIAKGSDPVEDRREAAAARSFTVAILIDRYMAEHARENRAKTVSGKRSVFDRYIRPRWAERAAASISKADVTALLADLTPRPATRRLVFATVRHLFAWGTEQGHIAANPCDAVKPPRPVASRERILTDDEIRGIFAASGTYAAMATLALLTAQRRGSIASMRWTDLDLDRGIWTVPASDMKTKTTHVVPLSPAAVEVISACPRFKDGAFVFGAASAGQRPYSGFSQGHAGLTRQMGSDGWRFHDLRRTAVSLCQRAGVPLDHVMALTGHKHAGPIGVYARHSFTEEKRRCVEALSIEIAVVTSATTSSAVVVRFGRIGSK